ncbi:AI-2E family transporter [Roseomonas sp. PWR1]|uniref:AI-2E family transporter n=1 Tax=Roseomonas nitratireducens TaxID=2820810 RepID=A0ABS4AS66_9PROT|nr:AI-2E family transporter [Neoroseomonas nitratireducens]MBP0464192.1 AI-2E family transporter [Neoroseomonas nitratireducens]
MAVVDQPGGGSAERGARSKYGLLLVALALAAGAFMAWQTAGTLLMIFGGLLLAALLDAATRGLQHLLPLGRGVCFAIVCTLSAGLILMGVAWGGYTIVHEWDELHHVLRSQLENIGNRLAEMGVQTPGPRGGRITDEQIARILLPDPAGLFGQARSALGTAGDVLLMLFIGFFVGLNPAAYRRGLGSILPRERRDLVLDVFDDMAETLRWWLVGQVVTIVVVALSIAFALMALGTPGALVLGLLAGLLNFIPYLGAFVGAVPIAIAASSQGSTMVVWVIAIYLVIQIVEGYVLTPLVQRRTVHIQPAHALGMQMLMGTLFGAVGIALAAPLQAVLRVAIMRWSVGDGDQV